MSYQEIKRISRGRKWLIITLIVCTGFLFFIKRVARAQGTFEVSGGATGSATDWICTHQYTATYTFNDFLEVGGNKTPLQSAQVHKCDPVTVDLTQSGIWSGRNVYSPPPCGGGGGGGGGPCGACACACTACGGACGGGGGACACGACACGACACGPPADVISCNSLDDCLNQGTLYDLDSSGKGKGVVKSPQLADLTAKTSSPYFTCSGRQCTAYASGNFSFEEKAGATKYYGQCKDSTGTAGYPGCSCTTTTTCDACNGCNTTTRCCVNQETCVPSGCWGGCTPTTTCVYAPHGCTPESTVTSPTVNVEADVAEQKNTVSYNVINRPPQVTASSSPAVANPDQEVSVTCQATDPDCANDPAHTDRVSRIKWSCADKQGKNTDCYFGKDDVWHTSAMTENLQSTSVVANPYDSTVKFKASSTGAYSVGCEATDNDPLNPLTAKGVTEVIVADNSNTNSDTGGIKYCSVLADTGERDRIVCVKAQSDSSTVNYKAYTFGMDPQTYRWRCFLSDNVQESSQDSKQCTYPIGYFMPYLSIIDKSGEEINCNSTISTKVTCIPKCSVVARETGSADDYSSEAPVSRGKDADAIIKQECLEEGDATWNVVGGTVVSQNSRGLEAKFNDPNVAQGKIGARINKNGVVTICDDAVVNIKDKMKWAQ